MLRLGLRVYAMVAVYSYDVRAECYTSMNESYLILHKYRVGDVQILQKPSFPPAAKYTPYHFCNIRADRQVLWIHVASLSTERSACKRWPGPLAVPPISNRQGL